MPVTEEQKRLLASILAQSPALSEILAEAPGLGLSDYYVGAGAIAQTVWNHLLNRPPLYGISDVDFVYFDPSDLGYAAEDAVIRRVKSRFQHLPLELDVKNQARVHLWYESRFGYPVPPYRSLEGAIDTWPATATAVGVRRAGAELTIYAPFGLDDLFGLVVRANKARITREIYEKKCAKWRAKWPELTIIPWEDCVEKATV